MTAIILDTETTDATDDREMIEAAYMPIALSTDGDVLTATPEFNQRYRPAKPITFGAMATHHILPSDILHCPPPSEFALPAGVEYLVGHKIDFDWETIGRPDVKRICTLAIARRLWPDTSHTLGALMYQISGNLAYTREALRNAHSALADVRFCCLLLEEITSVTGITTLEALWEFSESCRIPTHMTFGKHTGTAIAELPIDYVLWFLRQDDIDLYLRKAFEGRVQRRLPVGVTHAN